MDYCYLLASSIIPRSRLQSRSHGVRRSTLAAVRSTATELIPRYLHFGELGVKVFSAELLALIPIGNYRI